jgi:hypothetical protein
VVDHVQGKFPSESIGIAFVYCDYKDQDGGTASALIATLAKQLAARKAKLPQKLVDLYEELDNGNKQPNLQQLESLLLSLCGSFTRTFVFVDALDECNVFQERRQFLSTLQSLQKASVRTFVTSRPNHEDIKTQFNQVPQVEIEATENDIKRYVKQRMTSNPIFMKRITPELEKEIIDIIASRASGM